MPSIMLLAVCRQSPNAVACVRLAIASLTTALVSLIQTHACPANVTHRAIQAFSALDKDGRVRLPIIPVHCDHNAHVYYILLHNIQCRTDLIEKLNTQNISTVFHYIPLHSSPAGLRYSKISGDLSVTDAVSDRLLRLPLWCGLEEHQNRVIDAVIQFS